MIQNLSSSPENASVVPDNTTSTTLPSPLNPSSNPNTTNTVALVDNNVVRPEIISNIATTSYDGNANIYLPPDPEFPPGFRFCPTDGELIYHYLQRKIMKLNLPYNKIKDVSLYAYTPDKLSEEYEPAGENAWYFFTPRDRRYKNGARPSRAAGESGGFWKATGKEKPVHLHPCNQGEVIGFKRSLVFYRDKSVEKSSKTSWIMQEFRVDKTSKRKRLHDSDMKLDDWVLCKIYNTDYKSSKGHTKLEIGNEANPNSIHHHHQYPANPEANMVAESNMHALPFQNMYSMDPDYLLALQCSQLPEDMSHNIGMQQPIYDDYQHGFFNPEKLMNPQDFPNKPIMNPSEYYCQGGPLSGGQGLHNVMYPPEYCQGEPAKQQDVYNPVRTSCMNPLAEIIQSGNNPERRPPFMNGICKGESSSSGCYNPEKRPMMNPARCFQGPSSGEQSTNIQNMGAVELDNNFIAPPNNNPPSSNAPPSASHKDNID